MLPGGGGLQGQRQALRRLQGEAGQQARQEGGGGLEEALGRGDGGTQVRVEDQQGSQSVDPPTGLFKSRPSQIQPSNGACHYRTPHKCHTFDIFQSPVGEKERERDRKMNYLPSKPLCFARVSFFFFPCNAAKINKQY